MHQTSKQIQITSAFNFEGLVELALSSYFLLLRPCVPSDANPDCKPPTDLEILIFYISIYQIALGNGAYQPVVTTFGADQFDEQDKEEGQSKMAFFSYFFMANNLGTLFSNTLLAYVEDRGDWVLGFWISAGAAFLAAVLFFAGTPQFRHFMPGGNPLTRVSQVVVASMKNWKVTIPPEGENLYEDDKRHCAINGGRKILHTPDFTFLDRAAVYTDKDPTSEDQEQPLRPWSLCTVTQVEEVKSILRLMPIWLCTIIYSLVYAQMSSIFIEQGAVMNTSISSFHIPPACMSLFEVSSVAAAILLYRLCIVPFFLKVSNGRLKGLTELQRMGIGLVISTIAMILAGLMELQRLKHAKNDCYTCRGSSSLSILWQIPQYVLIGVSEVFMYVGQLEFFNNQIPETIKSFGSALYVANMSAGSYLSSLLVTIVMDITGKGDQTGWISENLNKGHMDRFYFLLAALNTLDLVVFMACAKRYRCILLDGRVQFGNDDRMSKTDM
ncbi:protein NRT1/ PTR FAMILY 7.3-like [Typha angustifolia]|uniref:protein NRT1/ PTR FAMILY 7.3-like n=1 Tax=Typha angustifolia TaxID=59011 RepID=UPI003C2F2C3E